MSAQASLQDVSPIVVQKCTPFVGAEISNIDLTRPLPDDQVDTLRKAFADYSVLFFRDQHISFEDHVRLGEYFGEIGDHVGKKTISQPTGDPRVRKFHADAETKKVSGDLWHTDQSCAEVPPLASVLYLHTLPEDGAGDTLFSSMYAAFDGLSDRMKRYLRGMTAIHDGTHIFGEGTPSAEHPVIVRHPDSGRELIYVNSAFTMRIKDVPEEESRSILDFLFAHVGRPEWTYRFRWTPHAIAMWDNRSAQHMAIDDYWPQTRSGFRIQLDGKARPVASATESEAAPSTLERRTLTS